MRLTLTRAAVAALLLGGIARADVSAPAKAPAPARDPEEIRCGGPEWPAVRRAVAAWCELHDEGCRAIRHAFRTCPADLSLTLDDPPDYRANVYADGSIWSITFAHERKSWRVLSVSESGDESHCH